MRVIQSIQTIIEHVKPGDWVFLDIDDTILLPAENKYKDQPTLLKGVADAIHDLKRRDIPVVFLTARHGDDPHIRQTTYKQLKHFGIEPTQVLPSQEHDFVLTSRYHDYDQGVLYARKIGEKPQKGNVLVEFLNQLAITPKKILVADDNDQELQAMQGHLAQQNYSYQLFHCQPDQSIIRGFPDDNPELPNYLTQPKESKHLESGGGGVHVLTYEDGRKYTLKAGSHSNQMKDEILADAIYRALGYPVPDFAVFEVLPESLARTLNMPRTGPYRLAEYIESDLSLLDNATIEQNLASGFVLDALISNYDIKAKNDYSNIAVNQEGHVYRLDNGANLRFRAKGHGKQISGVVTAIDDLRQYYNIDDQAITKQVRRLLQHAHQLTEVLYRLNQDLELENGDHLVQRYLDRLVYLKNRFAPDYPLAIPYHPAEPQYTSAGTLVYSDHPEDGTRYVLLGQRVRHAWWGNLGGKSDEGDQHLAFTAARETEEESLELINVNSQDLVDRPYNDLITHDEHGSPHQYRMYFVAYEYIPSDTFNRQLSHAKDKHQCEYNRFAWVAVSELVKALNNPVSGRQEGQNVIFVQSGQEQLALHPPFYQMLAQDEVKHRLESLAQGRPLSQHHSRALLTPQLLREQVSEQALRKAEMLGSLKRRHADADRSEAPIHNAQTSPSTTQHSEHQSVCQSDIHLQTVVGNPIRQLHDRDKIKQFAHKSRLAPESLNNEAIINQFTDMMGRERKANANNQTVLYHAAQNEIGFLYDVFTQLQQYLSVIDGTNTRAFRAFEEHTRQFSDVASLVSHFSNNGQAPIDNYQQNFQEMVLSCNLFLFGCDGNATSATYYLYLHNENRQPPKFQSLIDYVLASMDCPLALREQLLALYQHYVSPKGGRLYQIMINNKVLDDMVYTAGSLGKLAPITINGNTTYQPTEVLRALKEYPRYYRDYIKALQARLFLHPQYINDPHYTQVYEYSRYPLDPEYYTRLQTIIKRLVKVSLNNHAELEGLLLRTPIHQQTQSVLRDQQLQAKPISAEMKLVKAIRNNDLAKVQQVLASAQDIQWDQLPNIHYMDHSNNDSSISIV